MQFMSENLFVFVFQQIGRTVEKILCYVINSPQTQMLGIYNIVY